MAKVVPPEFGTIIISDLIQCGSNVESNRAVSKAVHKAVSKAVHKAVSKAVHKAWCASLDLEHMQLQH